jgi:hypothetical protein
MAGLLAARVLSDAYEQVTLVEHDELPPVGQGRRAVPQGRHAHVLLASGQRAIEDRLPGITAKIVDQAWDMAIGGDLALPDVEGHRPAMLRLTNAYVEQLLRVAEHDAIVAAAFSDVGDLLAPPQVILRPAILWRVLRGNLRRFPAPGTLHIATCRGPSRIVRQHLCSGHSRPARSIAASSS